MLAFISLVMNKLYAVKLLFGSVCAGTMDVDLDGIIRCIKQGDENGVHMQLQQFNKQVTHTHTHP